MDCHEDNEILVPAFPVHPGLVLKLDVLPSRKVTGAALAQAIGTPRPSITKILNGQKPITPEMAARIEAALGYSADRLVRMQGLFDLAHVKRELADRLTTITRIAA